MLEIPLLTQPFIGQLIVFVRICYSLDWSPRTHLGSLVVFSLVGSYGD
jgi:hypothetical protein